MPVRLIFYLRGPAPRSRFQHSTGLRALLLSWIRAVSPQLAQQLHDRPLPKPYSLSPLRLPQHPGGPLAFEVGLLDDTLLPLLLDGAHAHRPRLQLGRDCFELADWEPAGPAAWEELRHRPVRHPELELRLLTPTAHHTGDRPRKSVVLPSPELYFRGWLRRWNLHAPAGLRLEDNLAEWVERHIAIAECLGGTEAVALEAGRPFVGFVGRVRFVLLQPQAVPDHLWPALVALARLAEFAGTGVETMRGMGLTELTET